MLALSSGNVVNINFCQVTMFYQEKDLFEKAAAVKRSEYLPLSSELKKKTDITQKQNQGLDKIDEFGKKRK